MDDIYLLVGKIIEKFQRLENNLWIINFLYFKDKGFLIDNNEVQVWAKLDDKPLGIKLANIEKYNIIQEEDIYVINYLIKKRNYIVHKFFIESELSSEYEILSIKNKLKELKKEIEIILNAVKNLIIKNKNDWGVK